MLAFVLHYIYLFASRSIILRIVLNVFNEVHQFDSSDDDGDTKIFAPFVLVSTG